jgi:hypothetical protein
LTRVKAAPQLLFPHDGPSYINREQGGMMNKGVGLSTGIAIGIALGVAMHNIGLGIAIGIAIGIGFGYQCNRKPREDADGR